MTPLEIAIAIHYATRSTDYHQGYMPPPAVKKAVDKFCELGLLMKNPDADDNRLFCASEGMEVYLQSLCNVPLPTQRWVP